MKGKIISQDQGNYFISDDNGKSYQFLSKDWLGKNPPKIGDIVDFICEGNTIKSVFPLSSEDQPQKSKVILAVVCFCLGALGIHRFMVGKTGTGIVMLILSLFGIGLLVTIPWALIDFIFILTGNFSDKDGNKIS